MNEPEDRLMARAVELCRRGWPAPNPRVGCVAARGGQIVAEGWHDHAGGPHAEAAALQHLGQAAAGADFFVTLEPCSHQGRTPSCAHALVKAGAGRVFFAVPDPNPKAAGGAEVLRQAGIPVAGGLLQTQAEAANWPWLAAHRRQSPWVIIKAAITQDRFIARPDGSSKWITGRLAREQGHRLRAEMGAVLVGRGTVLADNPQLTARLDGVVNQPLRVVLDSQGSLPADSLALGQPGSLWAVTRQGDLLPGQARVSSGPDGRPSVAAVLSLLWQQGCMGVLVEGGGSVIRSFLEAGAADQIELFVAPIQFGEGKRWDGGLGREPEEMGFELASRSSLGQDTQLSYTVKEPK